MMDADRSTAVAHAAVEQLIAHGLQDAVLSPGSRNAPLSFALARAADAGRLRLHIHIDERSAGFLALGLAKASGIAALVVCTSGTAVANLLPAVVEASYAQVPMVVLTADRPSGALALGASQTIAQAEIFREFARGATVVHETSNAEAVATAMCGAWHRAHADHSGPVHINLAFSEPLVPPEVDGQPVWASNAVPSCEVTETSPQPVPRSEIDSARRGVVVVGDLPQSLASLRDHALEFARAAAWPMINEPTGGPRARDVAIRHHQLVTDRFLDEIDCVVTVGRFGLGRHLGRLVRAAGTHIAVQPTAQPVNPYGTATTIVATVPTADGTCDVEWLRRWQAADDAVAGVLAQSLAQWSGQPTGMHIARAVLQAAKLEQAEVFVAASRSVRDVDLIADFDGPAVWANLGTNGIDGLVSSVRGLAQSRPTFALLGDLAFLHDHNGLLGLAGTQQPDVTIVVTDDNGGAIFSDLEQGQPYLRPWFDTVFGTPHNLRLVDVVRAVGINAESVTTVDELVATLRRPDGVRVIVVSAATRDHSREFRAQLRAAAELL